jgi:hypothetical protein
VTTEQNLTPAQELRAAASKIRDTARLAVPGPWCAYLEEVGTDWHPDSDEYKLLGRDAEVAKQVGPLTAEHIALWHPGVAMLVAGWLWAVAIDCESDAETYNHIKERSTALSIARAINGEVTQ